MMDPGTIDKIIKESGYTIALCCLSCKYLINASNMYRAGDCKRLSVNRYVDKDGISWSGYFPVSYFGLCKYFEKDVLCVK